MNTNKRRLVLISFAAVLLMIPAIAMQFSNEVHWTILDFGVAAILLFGLALLLDILLKKFKTTKKRLLSIAIILIIFILLWIELAVGLFGSPIAGS